MDQIAATVVPVIQPPDQQGVIGQIHHRPGAIELQHLALSRLPEGRGGSLATRGGGHGLVGYRVQSSAVISSLKFTIRIGAEGSTSRRLQLVVNCL